MKVVSIETFTVPPRWLFCRIATDEDFVGWGEPIVEGRASTVKAAVHELAEHLVGQDPLRIEEHWQVLTKGGFYRGGPVLSSAVAGIDQALWDIAGQVYGAPIHALLGGHVRDRVRMYTWVGGDEPGEVEDAIAAKVEDGYTAIKLNATSAMGPIATSHELDEVVTRVRAAREILGPSRDVAVDFHGRVSVANARRLLPMLADLHPLFVEEPVLPEFDAHLASLVSASPVPLATGERYYHRRDFVDPLSAGIGVVQPDISHAGGISEVRRIAALAEVSGATIAPHCPLGPIALAASLQIAFATPNFLIQEQSLGIHYNVDNDLLDYLVDPAAFQFSDGYVERPLLPGLGIRVDEEAVRRADEIGHRWRSPVWRHADGGFAEW